MCWFQGGVTRSSGPPEPLAGLGLLEGSLTVHADGEPERLPVWLAAYATARSPAAGRSTTASGCCSAVSARARGQLAAGRRRAARRRDRRRARTSPPGPELLGERPVRALGGIDEDVQELRRVAACADETSRQPRME